MRAITTFLSRQQLQLQLQSAHEKHRLPTFVDLSHIHSAIDYTAEEIDCVVALVVVTSDLP